MSGKYKVVFVVGLVILLALALVGFIFHITLLAILSFFFIVGAVFTFLVYHNSVIIKQSKEKRKFNSTDDYVELDSELRAAKGITNHVSPHVKMVTRVADSYKYAATYNKKPAFFLKGFFLVSALILLILSIIFYLQDKTISGIVCSIFSAGIFLTVLIISFIKQRKSASRAIEHIETVQAGGQSKYEETIGTVVSCVVADDSIGRNVLESLHGTSYKIILDIDGVHKTAYGDRLYSVGAKLKVITEFGAKWASLIDNSDYNSMDEGITSDTAPIPMPVAEHYKFKLTVNDLDQETRINEPTTRDLVDAVNTIAKSETNFLVLESASPIDGILVIQANGCSPEGDYVWIEAIRDEGEGKESTIFYNEADAKTLVNILNDFLRYRVPDIGDWSIFN